MERQQLAQQLASMHPVTEAENAVACLQLLLEHTPSYSAVLLDLMMPQQEGFSVLAQMKATPTLCDIPVVAIVDAAATATRALELGASTFVITPIHLPLLLQTLRNTIAMSEAATLADTLRKDALTGLLNREAFFLEMDARIRQMQPGDWIISCMNVENFKVINDLYGVAIGDAVLIHLATCIADCAQAIGGICCRLSADLFAMLFPAAQLQATAIAHLHEVAATPVCLHHEMQIRIGRYQIIDLSLPSNAIVDRAMMAQASIKGRYDVCIADYNESMRATILHEQAIVGQMRTALADGAFEPWYQPQYNHDTGALIGAEALVRWRKPDGKLIPPNDFIPIFERNGFVYALDQFMWEAVCKQLRAWLDAGYPVLPVSVNISRYDILHADCIPFLTGLLETYHLPIALLRLEVTESAFSQSTQQIIAAVQQLIAMGFTVEIDDFGSGYSSLNTLKDVPASVLKLDMRFLESTGDSQRGGNILESVVRMAKWLGMSVIAEGVETEEQAEFLRSIGCCYVQGYLYARPMPADAYEALMTHAPAEEKLIGLTTVENLDNNAFWDPQSMETLIFNSYVGGACIFEYHAGKTELLRFNRRYTQEFGDAVFGDAPIASLEPTQYLDASNMEHLLANINLAIETGKDATCELCLTGMHGAVPVLYLLSTVRVIARAGDRFLFYCVIRNITSQRLAEQKERRLSSQIAAILANVNGGITAMRMQDGVPVLVFSNERFYAQLGYTKEQFETELPSVYAVVVPEERPHVKGMVAQSFASKTPCDFEYRCIKRDGSFIQIRCCASVTQIEGMGGDLMISMLTDITELVYAQEMLQSTSEHLQLLLENINGGVAASVIRDEKIRYLFANHQYYEMMGFTKEEYALQYGGQFNRIHPDDRANAHAAIMKASMDEKPYHAEFRVIRKDGSIGWLLCNVTVVHLAGVEEPVLLAVTSDITALREAQQQRIESAERLEAVMRNINGGVAALTISADNTLHYFFTSDTFYTLFGHTRPSESEEAFDILSAILPEDRERTLNAAQSILHRGGTGTFLLRGRHKDGHLLSIRCNASVCRMEHIADNVLIAVFTDVTDEKEADEQLRFLASAAHDILAQPDCEAAIVDALDRLMQFFVSDRAYVIELDATAQVSNNTYEVCAEGVTHEMERLQGIPSADYSTWLNKLAKNELIQIADVSALSDADQIVRDLLLAQSIHSLIATPMFRDGILIGYVGVDNPTLHTNQMQRLQALGDYIAILLTRRDLTAKIQRDNNALHSLMNDTPGGFVRMRVEPDETITVLFFNDGMCHLLGMSREEMHTIYGQNAMTGIYPDDTEIVRASIQRMIKGEDIHDIRYRMRCKGGDYLWITSFGRRVQGDDGEILLNIYYADVAQQMAEEAHQKSLLENLPGSSAIYEYDGKTLRVIHLNSSYWKLVQRKAVQYDDPSFLNAVHPDDRAIILHEIDAAIDQKRDCSVDIRILSGNGQYRPFHILGKIVPKARGISHIYVSYLPISEATMSLQAMLPIALSAVMEASADYTYVKDVNLRFVCCSPPLAKRFGLQSPNEIIGKTYADILEPALADRLTAIEQAVMATKNEYRNDDATILLSNGNKMHISSLKCPLLDANGNIIGLFGMGRDTTAEHEAAFELDTLLHVIPSGVLKYAADETATFAYINRNLISELGYTEQQFQEKFHNCFHEMIYIEDREHAEEEIRLQEGNGGIGKFDYRIEAADGSLRWFHDEGVLVSDSDGKSWYYVTLVDVTDQKEAQALLKQSEDEYRLAAYLSGSVMCRYHIADRTVTLTPEAVRRFSLPEKLEDVPYGRVRLGKISADTADAYIGFFEAICRGEKEGTATYHKQLPDGWRWITAHFATVFDEQGKPVSAVISYADITDHVETKERAETDALTGVMNRSAFIAKLAERLEHRKADLLCAFFMLDLDNFKLVNDTLGHTAGDRALRLVSGTLQSIVRDNDLVCRMGGDEFFICLVNIRSIPDIEKKAEQICKILRQSMGHGIQLSVSIGIAVCPLDGIDYETLYHKADKALYAAKRAGKSQFAFFRDVMTNPGHASLHKPEEESESSH